MINQMDVNKALTEIPCCTCTDWRRDKVVARLGAFYLAHEAGQRPAVPTRDELLRGCCRQPQEGLTLLGASLIGNLKVG